MHKRLPSWTRFGRVIEPVSRRNSASFFTTTIGYRLHPSYWGRGIATEAARAVRDHAFNDLRIERVISLIHPENLASRRVAEKNGMAPEKETVFRGFPAIVFGINLEKGNAR